MSSVVALDIPRAITTFLRPVVPPSVSCLAVPYFQRYLMNYTIFGEQVTEHKMCVLIFVQLLSETFLVIRRIQ